MSLVKVSVENVGTNDKILHEIDMGKSLEENIIGICDIFQQPYSPTVYGLKLLFTNDGRNLHTYISADNFNEIKDGYFLKLVYSISYYVKRIFDHISDEYKERSFQDLYELSVDPEFIKEIVKTEKHHVVMDVFTNTDLNETEIKACLIAIMHLFQKVYITDINQAFLDKVIFLTKSNYSPEIKKYALSVIYKILNQRDSAFAKWKEEAIKQMTMAELMNLIRTKGATELQYGALLVINTMIRCCKGDKRQQLIKEIDQKKHREVVYENIIVSGKIENNMAHELYIYQTLVLSLLAETLNSVLPESETLLEQEFEPLESDIKKMTLLMDFEEPATRNKAASLENLLEHDDVRISIASMQSEASRDSSRVHSSVMLEGGETGHIKPCLLTVEALRHYKKHHYKNFCQSQIEEKIYEPGIVTSSERIVRKLAKVLHIGLEPDRSSTCYQPTVFTCSSKSPFFFELFSRTMWLLSKTRREMKASTMLDYDKVIYVVTKQVKLVLDEKPMDLKKLTEQFARISYQTVMEIWQKEKEEELQNVLQNNSSVKLLKKRFSKQNEENIYRQRMNYVRTGTLFPKFNDKKIIGNLIAKLSNDGRNLLISDHNVPTKTSGAVKTYPLTDVAHLIEGKACPHVKNNSVKDPQLAFSILLKDETWINFKAADKKVSSYWRDALNLLLGKDNRSTYYESELSQLDEMDLVLHLMELQNVIIPKRAPPVPPPPFELKPTLPPKPQSYAKSVVK